MFERYTVRARRSLFFARCAASQLGSLEIGPEHLLLGVLHENAAVGSHIPRPLRETIERDIRTQTPNTAATIPTSVEIPFTSESKNILNIAAREADQAGHKHIGEEHLLLGILIDGTSLAASILRGYGVDADPVRDGITRLTKSLRDGMRLKDVTGAEITYRYFRETDDVDAITSMLHDAYAPLASEGMRFIGSHQDSETTRKRMAQGETIVAEHQGTIVGIITLRPSTTTSPIPFYTLDGRMNFGQFGVRPAYQRRGIGSTLLEFVEQRAAEQGAEILALDTSENAKQLIALYERKGYRFVGDTQVPNVNYRSVILAKKIDSYDPTGDAWLGDLQP